MNATTTQSRSGQLCEIGRYRAGEEQRLLLGRRIDGVVHVFDCPRGGEGRRYFVEAGFESKAELALLLADYRRQAERLGACPMSREAIERALAIADPGPDPSPRIAPPGGRAGGSGIGPASGGATDTNRRSRP